MGSDSEGSERESEGKKEGGQLVRDRKEKVRGRRKGSS